MACGLDGSGDSDFCSRILFQLDSRSNCFFFRMNICCAGTDFFIELICRLVQTYLTCDNISTHTNHMFGCVVILCIVDQINVTSLSSLTRLETNLNIFVECWRLSSIELTSFTNVPTNDLRFSNDSKLLHLFRNSNSNAASSISLGHSCDLN